MNWDLAMMFYKILHGQVDVDLPDYILGSTMKAYQRIWFKIYSVSILMLTITVILLLFLLRELTYSYQAS